MVGGLAFLVGSVCSRFVQSPAASSRPPTADILGIAAGDPFDEAKEKLAKLCRFARSADRDSARKPVGEDEDEAVFRPVGTPYKTVVVHKAGDRVAWITGFVRDRAGIPFEQFGDVKGAAKVTPSMSTWEVRTAKVPYRVLVQGPDWRATVVTILSPPVLLHH